MTPKKIKTRDVPRERYTTYLRKAKEFLDAVDASLSAGNWNAAGLNAAHCAISSADALLVYKAGVRSAGESHHDAAELLERHFRDEEVGGKAAAYSKILSFKNLAAYEDREMRETEAREAAKLARRFFEWAQSRLKGAFR
ncbi:MAG: HEPN domain-containing protein [Elusimicrobia bacterium]|nr:HEPN domain-containing protein [Elusimicrobiota bacterium]